jgi:hypothetical protein
MMNHVKIRKRLIYVTTIIAVVLIGIVGYALLQTEKNISLRELLSGKNCDAPCWQSIKPGISDEEDVTTIVDGVVDFHRVYTLEGEISTLSWLLNDTRYRPDRRGTVMVVFTEEGIVLRINVGIDVCVHSILQEYGEPVQVEMEGDHSYNMMYPDEGLMFTVNTDLFTTKAIAVAFTTPAEFAILQTPDGYSWQELQHSFEGDCIDNFAN